MPYLLQGLIAKQDAFKKPPGISFGVASLEQGLGLIPLTEEALNKIGCPPFSMIETEIKVPEQLEKLCFEL